jgi:hypothetical protein
MPLLTFSVLQEDLLAKTKLTSFRRNVERWEKFWRGCHNNPKKSVLSIWWNNPRFMRRNPNVYKMGLARWTGFETPLGHEITDGMARADGLKDRDDLFNRLAEKNKLTVSEVMTRKWARLIFEWMYGPFTQEQSKLVYWDTLLELQNQAVAPGQRCPQCGLIGDLVEDHREEKTVCFYSCMICGRTW